MGSPNRKWINGDESLPSGWPELAHPVTMTGSLRRLQELAGLLRAKLRSPFASDEGGAPMAARQSANQHRM